MTPQRDALDNVHRVRATSGCAKREWRRCNGDAAVLALRRAAQAEDVEFTRRMQQSRQSGGMLE